MPSATNARYVYRICSRQVWDCAREIGYFEGTAVDARDGYIHLSAADQVLETARRHYAGEADLVLLRVDGQRLGDALKWEVSRGGALFPHLYASLPVTAVDAVARFPLGADGTHQIPTILRADLGAC